MTPSCGIIFGGSFERESFRNGTFTLPDGAKIKVNLKTVKPTSKVKIDRAKTNDEIEWRKLKIDLNNDFGKIMQGVNQLRLRNNPIILKNADIKTILLKNN